MKLNLSDLKASEIKYEHRQYPDGQQDIIIDSLFYTYNFSSNVEIQSRFNSFQDLEKIICATKSLRKLGVKEVSLYIPYLLGARSDRKFVTGGNSYLVDVIAPIINSLNFVKVTSLDVHSDVAAACINNFESKSNKYFIDFVNSYIRLASGTTIISPDAGSEKKIYSLFKELPITSNLIIASKHRDIKTGEILSTEINVKNMCDTIFIIDDICDGGRTFIELAKAIDKQISPKPYKYLCITHGIFSNGFEELSKYFDGIFCTNSIKDIGDYSGNDLIKTNCKQLKVI